MLKFGKKGIITFLAAALAMVFASGAMAAPVITSADLKAKLEAGGNVELGGNIDDAGMYTISKDTTIDLAGHTITGHTITPDKDPLFNVTDGATLTINDSAANGKLISTNYAGIKIYGNQTPGEDRTAVNSKVILNAGTIEAKWHPVAVFGKGAQFDINGGVVKATESDGYGISGNGTVSTEKDYGGTVININGGKIIGGNEISGKDAGAAVYHPQEGILTITGGEFSGYNGIQFKGGTLNMSGGTITATGELTKDAPEDSSNGCVITGAALSLITNTSYAGNISARISGSAKLISEKANAVFERKTSGSLTQVISVDISEGTFQAAANKDALLFENWGSITNAQITGGTYSSDPSAYVANREEYVIVEKDGLFTVKGKAAPIVTPVDPKLPDGTSDDVKAEIKPATAVVLGVDTTKSAITEETKAAAITDTMKVISADITSKDLTVNEETGAVEISVATASEAAKGLLKDNETLASKDIAPLPVFTADVEIGKTAMVSYKLTGSALKAKTAEEVRVMKILSSTTAGEFEYASEITADMDGKFTIQQADGKIHSGALEAGTDYLLTLFIKDGSSFDLDGAKDGSITDPAAIFSTTTTEPQHGSSSSGCNGGFGALALLGLALVPMFYGKKR